MSIDLENVKMVLPLNHYEACMVKSAIEQKRRKISKQHDRDRARGWKPEPGKLDLNVLYLKQMDEVLHRLTAQMDNSLAKAR